MKSGGVLRDPVCGRRMNRNKAYAVVRHGRQEVLLCCPLCQSEFEADPQRFLPEAGQSVEESPCPKRRPVVTRRPQAGR